MALALFNLPQSTAFSEVKAIFLNHRETEKPGEKISSVILYFSVVILFVRLKIWHILVVLHEILRYLFLLRQDNNNSTNIR